MYLSMYCPTTPLRPKWGFTGGIDTKVLPHYGASDKGIDRQRFFTSWVCQIPMLQLGLNYMGTYWGFDLFCLPHCGAFDIRVCQIPTIAPYNPEGGW